MATACKPNIKVASVLLSHVSLIAFFLRSAGTALAKRWLVSSNTEKLGSLQLAFVCTSWLCKLACLLLGAAFTGVDCIIEAIDTYDGARSRPFHVGDSHVAKVEADVALRLSQISHETGAEGGMPRVTLKPKLHQLWYLLATWMWAVLLRALNDIIEAVSVFMIHSKGSENKTAKDARVRRSVSRKRHYRVLSFLVWEGF